LAGQKTGNIFKLEKFVILIYIFDITAFSIVLWAAIHSRYPNKLFGDRSPQYVLLVAEKRFSSFDISLAPDESTDACAGIEKIRISPSHRK
jgi:hypothetical protein